MIEGAAIPEYIAIGGFKTSALQGVNEIDSMENAHRQADEVIE